MAASNPTIFAASIFGALSIFYFASVALNLSYVSGLSLSTSVERELIFSLAARLFGGCLCVLLLTSLLKKWPPPRTGVVVAWAFAIGVAAILTIDNLGQTMGTWVIAACIILLHVFGALAFQQAMLR